MSGWAKGKKGKKRGSSHIHKKICIYKEIYKINKVKWPSGWGH